MAAQVKRHHISAAENDSSAAEYDSAAADNTALDNTRTLICALNFISRNLPLPKEVFDAVSDIYHNNNDDAHVSGDDGDVSRNGVDVGSESTEGKIALIENAGSHCHRLADLEELPASRGEDLQSKCLLELYGLNHIWNMNRTEKIHPPAAHILLETWISTLVLYKGFFFFQLAELQNKVRIEVGSEYWLRLLCANPEKQLFDWGMTRLPRPMYGIADAFATGSGDPLKKKRDAERLSRLEEEERNRVETRKRQFFADVLNAARELQLQVQASQKRRKQRNDGVHACIPLFSDHGFCFFSELPAPETHNNDENSDNSESAPQVKTGDLLEGQRQYNSAVHSIQEKVSEQPAMLQGGELRNYQLEGLQWMLSLFNNNLNGILADEMGLGKTIQTIALIAYLMENKGVSGPHLIIAPKAVLPNWMIEFSAWAPSIIAVLYDGRLDERKALREQLTGEGKFNVLVTHYDLIMRDKAFLKKIHWHYMIVDEGHRLKNHDCALARTLVTGYRIRRRLLLTGTPIQNSLQELWSLLNFLLPNIFNSVENFEEWFNAPFADKCDVSLTDEEELLVIRRLHHVIRPFILRRKKIEVEKFLPGKTQVILKCDLSAWQKIYYEQVTTIGRVGLGNGTGRSKSLQNLSMQLRKCCNHPYLFLSDYNMWNEDEIVRASGKFELLDRLLPKLRRAGHRILLFSQMTRLMDILEIYLQLHSYKYLRLDGSTKTDERGELLRKFNAPDSPYFMFLLSTRAGGLGLNLQTADTVIIFDSDWNPQMDQQAEDRAHRIGQKKEVRVFVLVSVGSIEEVILERAKQKMGIDAKVIQAGLFNTTSTAQDRRQMLEEIMRKGTSSLGVDVPSEKEINRLAARSEEEFYEFERMDKERRERERFRSRLMFHEEVPEWARAAIESNDTKGKGFDFDSANISGKRRRKEVVYADTLSDLQFIKAVENGGDFSKYGSKRKREVSSAVNDDLPGNNTVIENKELYTNSETMSQASEATSEDTHAASLNPEPESSTKSDIRETGMDGLTWWKPHKRKRSSLLP
ncbi:hypothetical protein Leryth_006297 [Lithospermum erythrorhizon]|nr:hypothetical protein Leryth_006297 [Lithospermum erythrorhizon]